MLEAWKRADDLEIFESGWTFDHLYPLMDHWNYSGTDAAGFATCCTVLHDACEAIDRDPAEITCSTILRWSGDAAAFRAEVEAMAAVGAELVIVSLPKSSPPSVVNDIAAAL